MGCTLVDGPSPTTAGLLTSDQLAGGLTVQAVNGQADQFLSTNHGTLAWGSDGSIWYIPNSGFVGQDSFTYTIGDASGATAAANATINVNPPSLSVENADGGDGTILVSNPTSGNTSSLAPDQIDNVQIKLALDEIFGSATEDWTGWKLTMAAEDSNGSPDSAVEIWSADGTQELDNGNGVADLTSDLASLPESVAIGVSATSTETGTLAVACSTPTVKRWRNDASVMVRRLR